MGLLKDLFGDDSLCEYDYRAVDERKLIEVENPGPPPREYRVVLIAAILIALIAWAWHALSDHASVLLK